MSFPYSFLIDDSDTPSDVIDALALGEFTRGAQPFARTARLERVRKDALLLPEGATVTHAAKDGGGSSHLAVGEGWTLRAVRWQGGSVAVTVTAVTAELARTVLDEATKDVQEPEPVEPEIVHIGFAYAGPQD
ncbi:DUF5925 domain-containing protein [Hamadaea tsunoensis]|uniref:DUF5925 domain-containing protein n=1 Tax=Hamadaea tsunoensis TaxID=53368 RepID=UPI0003FE2CCA|nr:DUF5925 domain-containing protein [Hamadaea tsunoensis]